MKKILYTLLLLIGICGMGRAQSQPYLPLPEIPASIDDFQQRSNYLVEHYWDRCNWKNAFSSLSGMAEAFSTYINLLTLAERDVALASVENMIKASKKNPQGQAFIVERALVELYSDSAQYFSEEVLLPFLQAGIDNKKVDKETRDRYTKIYSQLSHSRQGERPADVTMTLADGTTTSLGKIIDSDTTSVTFVYLYDPAGANHRLDRMRLAADSRLNNLIDQHVVKMVALYPGKADEAWRNDAKDAPANWVVGASPEAEMMFDLFNFPTIYVLDVNGRITTKNHTPESILNLLYSL